MKTSRVVDSDYTDFFKKYIDHNLVYPINNPCFNMAFSKFYNDQYIFSVRNIITYKQLINDINLYPGFIYYTNNEKNVHNNNNLSNLFYWEWINYYESTIFFVGNIDSINLKIKPNINIKPYYLLSPIYEYKLPISIKNNYRFGPKIKLEDFRLYFQNNTLYSYNSSINIIYTIELYNNRLILNKKYNGICEKIYDNINLKNDIDNLIYYKKFEKNWSLYNVKKFDKLDNEFKFIHDYEIDGLYGVSYFPQTNFCKKYKLIKYNNNTFPIDSKFLRFSLGSTCINLNKNKYLGIGHVKVKYNNLKIEKNEIKLDIEKHYINLCLNIHKKFKHIFGKNYRSHRWLMYMMYFFIYDEKNKTFIISDLFMPIPEYKFQFTISFAYSIQKVNNRYIIGSGLGDYTSMLYSFDLEEILNITKYNINDINLKDLNIFFIK
jgi:hypothetical protein